MSIFNQFINSAVRQVGRNVANDVYYGNRKAKTSNRYYDRAENELQKALNFSVKGRRETVLGNCFTMYQAFDDELKTTGGVVFDLLVSKRSIGVYYSQCMEKIKDCKEYLELKDSEDDTVGKLEEIRIKITRGFKAWINKRAQQILEITTPKDRDTLRHCWYGFDKKEAFKDWYTQSDNDLELIAKIEAHLAPKEMSRFKAVFVLLGATVLLISFIWFIVASFTGA